MDRQLEERPGEPITGIAGKVERAFRNYLETLPFFVAAVVTLTDMKPRD